MIAIYLSAITDEEEKSKFMMLYDKYAGLMYYTARQLTDDENKAADIVHETFIRIISKLDIIRTENDNETTALIYKMTRYCGIDYLRKEKNMLLLDDVQTYEENTADDNVMVDTVYIKEIMKIIKEMDEMYSVPLQLKADGYKTDEIAALLGISKENVKVRIHRARKIVKERLEGK